MSAIADNPGEINIYGIEGYDDGFVYDKNEDIEEQCTFLQMQIKYVDEKNAMRKMSQKSTCSDLRYIIRKELQSLMKEERNVVSRDEYININPNIVHTMDFSLRPMPYQPGCFVESDTTDFTESKSAIEEVD